MTEFANTLIEVCTKAQPIVTALCCIALLVVGVLLIYPNQKAKETGKDHLPWIVIGAAIALSAVSLGKWIGSITAIG